MLLQSVSKQWGYQTVHGTNPVTYDLPIPFEEAPFTVAISTGNSGNHASCGGFTKTTIVLRAGTTAGVWDTVGFFIIGCQLQWGIKTEPYGLVTFPISFQTCFGVITHFNSDPTNYAETSSVTNFSNTDFYVVFYFNNSGSNAAGSQVFWVAIGNS